jgi:hypothetical protein
VELLHYALLELFKSLATMGYHRLGHGLEDLLADLDRTYGEECVIHRHPSKASERFRRCRRTKGTPAGVLHIHFQTRIHRRRWSSCLAYALPMTMPDMENPSFWA